MNIYKEQIIPYIGITTIKLYMHINEVKTILKNAGIKYNIELWPNKGCEPEVPWQIIRIENTMDIFFANEKIFKISFKKNYLGTLDSGIKVGMLLDEAVTIDKSLHFVDDNDDYESDNGYWVEIDYETNNIVMISIFIKEALDEENFFQYKW